MLKINKKGMMEDFIKKFYDELDIALKNWKTDVEKFSSGYIKSLGVPSADYNKIMYLANRMIVVYFKANPTLLADIYGTGSKINKSNPKFQAYWTDRGNKQGQVNPARTSTTIQGRPKGPYTDIFGKTRISPGTKEGKNVEKGFIKPIDPNQELLDKYFGTAIEIGNKFFKTTYLDRAISNAIKSVKISNYIIEVN